MGSGSGSGSEPGSSGASAISVLLVCTANICRSPMAEALLRRSFERAGIRAVVDSAGTSAVVEWDCPPVPEAVQVMATMELDIADHRSRPLTVEDMEATDLVIGLARENLRDAAVLSPESLPRLVTLKELVRRGAAVGAPVVGEDLGSWLSRVTVDRPLDALLGDSPGDDVDDPIGRPVGEFRRVAGEISDLADRVVGSLSFIGRPAPRP